MGSSPPCTCHLTWTHTVGNALGCRPLLRLLLQQGDDSWLWEPMSCSGGDPGSEHLCPGPYSPSAHSTLSLPGLKSLGTPRGRSHCGMGPNVSASLSVPGPAPPRPGLTRDPGPAGQSAHCSPLLLPTLTSVDGAWWLKGDSPGAFDGHPGHRPCLFCLVPWQLSCHLYRVPSVTDGRKRCRGR